MKMKKRKNRYLEYIRVLFVIGISFVLMSCARNQTQTDQTELFVYYINKEYTSLIETTYQTETDMDDTQQIINELVLQLALPSEEITLNRPINSSFSVEEIRLDKNQLMLDLTTGYLELEPLKEVLTRAAIVQTLLQLDYVESVLFTVDGSSITNTNNQVIGRMDQNTFINTTGSQMNSYEKTTLQIYFSNETGEALLPVQRTLVYSSNISMEKLVLEQIIVGPATDTSFPTVNNETTVLGVTVKDQICYVNLSEDFLKQVDGVSAETTIYSIVNSLIEINDINKVQISVEGETTGVYIGNMQLSTIFERNLEIIER